MTKIVSCRRLAALRRRAGAVRLLLVAFLVLSCTETRELNGWLRVHETDEITIVPHMLTLGGDPTMIEVRVGDAWVPVLRGVRQGIWALTSDSVLTELDTADGVAFFLLREGHRQPVKRWASDDAEMEMTPERGLVYVAWIRSRRRLETPDRVRVEVFDSYGLDGGHAPGAAFAAAARLLLRPFGSLRGRRGNSR
jgi:hypothetical protein